MLYKAYVAPATENPPTRGHKKKARTKRRLLDAALDLVAERGEAFSVADVVERAEVSHGTFYNHFDDRDAVTQAVVDELLSGLALGLEAAVDESDPVQRFASITVLAIRRATEHPRGFEALLRLGILPRVFDPAGPLRHLRADLAAGVNAGRMVVDDADAAVDVVFGTIVMASMHAADSGMDAAREHATVTQLLRSLGVATGAIATIVEHARHRADELAAAADGVRR